MLIQIRIKIATCLCNCPLRFAMYYQRHCRFCQIIDFEELYQTQFLKVKLRVPTVTQSNTHIRARGYCWTKIIFKLLSYSIIFELSIHNKRSMVSSWDFRKNVQLIFSIKKEHYDCTASKHGPSQSISRISYKLCRLFAYALSSLLLDLNLLLTPFLTVYSIQPIANSCMAQYIAILTSEYYSSIVFVITRCFNS